MKIRNSEIGTGRTFIIAELCSNIIRHLDNLPNIIRWCKESGADAVKIQLFQADHFPDNERESKRRLEFPRERFKEFVGFAHACDLAAGASVFDEDAAHLLKESGGDFFKLATREYRSINLFNACNDPNIPLIYSYDCMRDAGYARIHLFNAVRMACVPQYPAEKFIIPSGGNLKAWSSHTSHWNDVIIAVSRGAAIVEKHVKIDKDDPEAGWSLYLDEFEQLVKDVRWTESVR